MNIGVIIPSNLQKKEYTKPPGLMDKIRSFFSSSSGVEVSRADILEDLSLVICSVPFDNPEKISERCRRKMRSRIRLAFEKERALPLLEHPKINGLCGLPNYEFEEVIRKVALKRFPELLNIIRGIGNLEDREVTVTGNSPYLEYAISSLITKVKVLNLLLPMDSVAPAEAEQAFEETGIPVHITNDAEVLGRSAIWIRFPDDHKSFDILPRKYDGIIVDLGAMKIVDTKNRKIFSIVIEFSERIRRKIGFSILEGWKAGYVESAVIAMCANMWNMNLAETSLRLGTVLTFIT